MGKNLDAVNIAEYDPNGWSTIDRADAMTAAAIDEQEAEKRGYDRCIADVAAWLRGTGMEFSKEIRQVLCTVVFCLERGEALRWIEEQAGKQPQPEQDGPR